MTIGSAIDLTNTASTNLIVEAETIHLDASVSTDSGSVTPQDQLKSMLRLRSTQRMVQIVLVVMSLLAIPL